MVRIAPLAQPHRMVILLESLFDLPAGIEVLQITRYRDQEHHVRMENGTTASFISCQHRVQIQIINHLIYPTYREIGVDQLLQGRRYPPSELTIIS